MKPFVFVANKGKERPESRENGLRMLYFTRLKYNESDIENEREKWENETENCKIYIKMKDKNEHYADYV